MSKVSTCSWFGNDAETAGRFYVALVAGSSIKQMQRFLGALSVRRQDEPGAPAWWAGHEAFGPAAAVRRRCSRR